MVEDKKRVLIVEDDQAALRLFSETLEKSGKFIVSGVSSAEEAQKILLKNNFNFAVCLVDYVLPTLSGKELLAWIKKKSPCIAVIMITETHNEQLIYECLGLGALDFLEKPIQLKSLVKSIWTAGERQIKVKEAPGDIQAEVQTEGWVELTAPSEMEYLARMQHFTELLLSSKLTQAICDDLRLAMEEVGRNAIEWGNKFDHSKNFHINYCIFNDRIVFKFEDEGEGFQPEKLRDPTKDPKKHIKKRKEEGKRPGGFGVYLINTLMDNVVYSEKGNMVVMTKYF